MGQRASSRHRRDDDGEHDDEVDALMTRADIARYLRCSLSSVDRLRLGGDLGPATTVGRRGVRYYRSAVEAYIARNTPPHGTPGAYWTS